MKALIIALAFVTLPVAATVLPPDGNPALWTPEQRVEGFRTIAKFYGGDPVHHGTNVVPLPTDAHPLQLHYDSAGVAWDASKFMEHNHVAGLIVLHHGKVVLEQYRLGHTPKDQWVSFSVAKSVTSTLLGVAIHDGFIKSVDEPVTRYIPELAHTGYADVTLKQALTMSVGLRWKEDYKKPDSDWGRSLSLEISSDHRPPVDIVKYMGGLPRVSPPGSTFLYNSGNAQIIGVVVERATHRKLAAYLEEKIWRPLGMEADAFWVHDRFGRDLGRSMLNATLRDYARFGYFFMHGGKIGNGSILPDGWVAEASHSHIPTGWGDIGYGYEWWINADGTYRALGIFGQMIFLDPKSDVVIVTNSVWPEADWDPGYDAVSTFCTAVVQRWVGKVIRCAGTS
jgi:CubicO group peptidase (beta-lactamase class C family)